jgi:integrase
MISVPRSKNGEPRHVEMTPQVLSIFRGLPRPLKADGYYFTNHAGQPHYRWFKRILPKRIAQAGLENFRAHDLRHTWASRLVMSGVDLVTLQQLGGWKSITMVQRYAHLSPGHRRAAINRLPEIPLADGSVTRPEVRKRIDT